MTNISELINGLLKDLGVQTAQLPEFSWLPTVAVIVVALLGIIYCFFGYKAVRLLATIIGMGVGLLLGFAIVGAAKLQTPFNIIVPIAIGVIFAFFGYFLYRVGVFLVVLLEMLCIAAALLMEYTKLDETVVLIAALVIAVIFSVLSVVYLRPLVIISTAISGAMMFSNEIFENLIKVRWSSQVEMLVRLCVGAVLAIIGIIYQFRTTRPKVEG